MDYSFKIINSSAGSGKTFNLATEYIAKLLKSEDEEHFKSCSHSPLQIRLPLK